jgi:hypothetical protein
LGATAVVVFTALAIWMLRPGDPLTPGTGGLAHRQPRATWLVAGAIVAVIIAVVAIPRSRRLRRRANAAVPVAVAVLLVGAVVAGVLWPSGLLRHYAKVASTPAVTSPTLPAATNRPGGTTVPGATTVAGGTSVPGATTAPAGTTNAPTTPTT